MTTQKTEAKKRKKKKSKFRIFLNIQLVLIVLVLLGVCFYYFSGYGTKIKGLKDEAVKFARSSSDSTFRASETSVVYDKTGKEITTLSGEKDVYYLSFDQIPPFVKRAFVAVEDKKFYNHNGIDLRAILRAAKAFFEHGEPSEGASTITQQLARNIFLSYEKTWERKVEEIFLAIELEQMYSKDKILEYYINNIYFANGHYGIQAAAKGYFSKDVSELNISELAFLVAIPNSPNLYDPVQNYDNTVTRRNRVLEAAKENDIITEEQYNEAIEYRVTLNMSTSIKRNYVETYTYNCATRALMETAGFKFKYEFESTEAELQYDNEYAKAYAECQQKLYTGGYRIYTSIDLDKQQSLQNKIDTALADYSSTNAEGVYQLQGAGVCINNLTGYVEAIVGGRSQDMVGYTLNRAYQSFRQPGSTIKPILVYTPALERGYTPNTTVIDAPIEDGPNNADGGYAGEISLKTAVAVSKNTVAWNLLKEMTPQAAMKYLFAMNFTHLSEGDYHLPSALGGLTYGVSAVEMAGAYETIANDGIFKEPTCIVKICDASGKDIWERKDEGKRVYQASSTRNMTDMLKAVLTYGTGKGYGLNGMDSAGKTGTTNDDKDSWFVGYSHYYTTSVWVAYDMPQVLPGTVINAPIQIWKSYMDEIHNGLEPVNFSEALY